jgi:hypothetical protein
MVGGAGQEEEEYEGQEGGGQEGQEEQEGDLEAGKDDGGGAEAVAAEVRVSLPIDIGVPLTVGGGLLRRSAAFDMKEEGKEGKERVGAKEGVEGEALELAFADALMSIGREEVMRYDGVHAEEGGEEAGEEQAEALAAVTVPALDCLLPPSPSSSTAHEHHRLRKLGLLRNQYMGNFCAGVLEKRLVELLRFRMGDIYNVQVWHTYI